MLSPLATFWRSECANNDKCKESFDGEGSQIMPLSPKASANEAVVAAVT